jgi:hypothetical protein
MAHFAEIKGNIVQRVLVVPDSQEHRGQEFLANDLKLGGTWIQCSYNGNIRKQFPGRGYTYKDDVFIAPQPYPSWVLNENHDWVAPIEMPTDGMYNWNEEEGTWDVVEDSGLA